MQDAIVKEQTQIFFVYEISPELSLFVDDLIGSINDVSLIITSISNCHIPWFHNSKFRSA